MGIELNLADLNRLQLALIDKLLGMQERQHFALWKRLEAPPMNELQGEYTGMRTLKGADEETFRRSSTGMFNPQGHSGFWLGKAFRTTGTNAGEGYNRWGRVGGRIERNMRFGTKVAPSLIDGKPALHMRYADFNNRLGDTDLYDEIRRYENDVYLGVATRAAPDGKRTAPAMFFLVGPGTPWRGVDDESLET